MSALRLFARTRRWAAVGAVCVASGALIVLCGPLSIALNPVHGSLVRVATLIPVIPAVAIQASLSPRITRQEATAARQLARWRALHVLVLSAAAAIVVSLASLVLIADPDSFEMTRYGPESVLRNLLALTGTALIGARLFGSGLGWVLPLSWMIIPPLLVPQPTQDPTGIVTLIAQGDGSFVPLVTAWVVWGVGLWAATRPVR